MEENEKIIAQINSISEGSLVDLINVVAADYIVSGKINPNEVRSKLNSFESSLY